MDMFVHVLEGLSGLFGLEPMLAMTVGVILGILAGAMPGISPAMGVALIVPFTFTMHPSTALILLTAIYIAANYGGSITAVTINTPGTPSAGCCPGRRGFS